MNQNTYSVYYAHHQWKYGTQIEQHELEVIRKFFPTAAICNPSTDINCEDQTEENIMKDCLKAVSNSDVIVFSSVDGNIGHGVWQEVRYAQDQGKLVLYLYQCGLHTNYYIARNWDSETDRLYGFAGLTEE